MTLREFGKSISIWFHEVWNTIKWFFVDMYEKIINGDFLDLTLWQIGFLLILILFILKAIYDEYNERGS